MKYRKRVITCAVLVLLFYIPVAKAIQTKPLLEVRVFSRDGIAAREYLYLRVFHDGRVEYEDAKQDESEFADRETKLSSQQVQSLKEFLSSAEVQKLEPAFPPAYTTIDYRTLIRISLNSADKTQLIEIPNYNLPAGKDKDLYPQALINLMCRSEQVRGNTSSRLTAKGWCTIWAK